jgi:hypothetical protein
MSSLKTGLYSRIFKHFILNASGHEKRELEAKCYYDPSQLFYDVPHFAMLDKCGKNWFL